MKQSVRVLWTPLLGEVWAEKLAQNVQRLGVGYIASFFFFFFFFFLGIIIIPFALRGSDWAWVLSGLSGVASVVSVALAWRSLVQISKELGQTLRSAGFAIKQNPGTQNVIAYRRWLRSNGLTAEQVREVAVHELP